METVTLAPHSRRSQLCLQARPARVFVDGQRRYDLHVLRWQSDPAPLFGHVLLMQQQPTSGTCDLGGATPEATLDASSTVTILGPVGMDQPVFVGRLDVVDHQLDSAEDRQTLRIVHELALQLAAVTDGRWTRDEFGAPQQAAESVQFNATSRSRASADLAVINGRTCRLFSDADDAILWSAADALAYLIACHMPNGIDAPDFDELNRLAGGTTLPPTETGRRSLAEMMSVIAGRGGVFVRAAGNGFGIEIYRPGMDGALRRIRASATAGGMERMTLSQAHRRSVPTVRVVGGDRCYESTFTLLPLDEPSASRAWGLNEANQGPGPWTDLSVLDADTFLSARRREFLPRLSAIDGNDTPVVEYRLSSGAAWVAWSQGASLSDEACSLMLLGTIPQSLLDAAFAGTLAMRITASVQADQPVTATLEGDPYAPPETIYVTSEDMQILHPDSIYSIASEPVVLHDPAASLDRLAQQHVATAGGTTVAEIALGWADTSFEVGDRVQRVEGTDDTLVTNENQFASVRRVTHVFDTTQQTQLILET